MQEIEFTKQSMSGTEEKNKRKLLGVVRRPRVGKEGQDPG